MYGWINTLLFCLERYWIYLISFPYLRTVMKMIFEID